MWYLIEFSVQGATKLHILDQVRALTLVWGNDANLAGLGSSLKQPGGDLLHVGSLRPETHQHHFSSKLRQVTKAEMCTMLSKTASILQGLLIQNDFTHSGCT